MTRKNRASRWRTWGAGFTSLEAAMVSLREDMKAGKRWNPHMPDDAVKWRVERRIVWTRYYEPIIQPEADNGIGCLKCLRIMSKANTGDLHAL